MTYGLSPWNPAPDEWECTVCGAWNDRHDEWCVSVF
jgi:hypothetical protein